ncbi:ABC transporter permease [Arthrobacter sp. Rue61a]|uniref:ABC-type dipeptide/oligopeptide transport systems, permease components n=1 Tax=Paenarthrobacter aurescens (strain TC1) TaxID=290340 RepID=A1R300_PAEAT|nr:MULTISPECIES: ABC transporter permease [Micrococcaceae]ABM08733.1 putative ABC-type dipeptide/oligopeptide transport systems, permease components [Paenarthrobacter aurescens TC1]AFR27696.1 glutathione transport system permease protein GsiC [Arthrobacter sp. Rue61a]
MAVMDQAQAPAPPQGPAGKRAKGRAVRPAVFIAKKVLALVATLFVASLAVFFSRFLVPGDPARFLLRGRSPKPEALEEITRQFGLDKPAWEQYLNWLGGILQGDWGRSLTYRQDVSDVLLGRLPTTLQLVALAAVFITVLGLFAGIVASLNKGFGDRFILITLTAAGAVPPFVAAIALVALFSVGLGWFPSFGSGDGGWDRIWHLTLPALALGITYIAMVARVTRSSMNEQLLREHVEVATSRGLTRGSVVARHVLRNALGPILTVSGVLVAGLLVSSAIIERTFGLSGIGQLLVQSIDRLDFGVVQAIVMVVVAAFVLVNTVVDLVQPLIDPRIAAGTESR